MWIRGGVCGQFPRNVRKYPLPTPPHLIIPFIRHFHISHNTPYLPPKVLHNLCFSFLLIIRAVPRKIENYAYAKMWGANKVHYGKRGSDVLVVFKQHFFG